MAENNYENLFNSDVVDLEGNKIGSIGQVYLDDQTGQPSWVTVKTGWFGLKETFVPLEQAEITEGQIKVPYAEDKVKDAPRVDPDKHLDADEEAQLYDYYGIATVIGTANEQHGDAVGTDPAVAQVDVEAAADTVGAPSASGSPEQAATPVTGETTEPVAVPTVDEQVDPGAAPAVADAAVLEAEPPAAGVPEGKLSDDVPLGAPAGEDVEDTVDEEPLVQRPIDEGEQRP